MTANQTEDTLKCVACDQSNLDLFACPSDREACLACCGCPEHLDEGWTVEDTNPDN